MDMEYVSAIVAVDPGGAPQVGSEQYQKLLDSKFPIIILFGDYIDNEPADILSTEFWKSVRDGAVGFADNCNLVDQSIVVQTMLIMYNRIRNPMQCWV